MYSQVNPSTYRPKTWYAYTTLFCEQHGMGPAWPHSFLLVNQARGSLCIYMFTGVVRLAFSMWGLKNLAFLEWSWDSKFSFEIQNFHWVF